MEIVHTPVLLRECLDFLSPVGEPYEKNAFMIDSTLGEGGHTNAFLSKYPELKICGVDADSVIQQRAKERLSCFGDRIRFFNGWFNDFYSSYPAEMPKPDLILFDLGISVFHYEKSNRGFSFRYDETLDMRLNENGTVEARSVSEISSSKSLAEIIYNCVPEKYRHGAIHPATRTFQALRIAANDELGHLPKALFDAFNCLNVGGKMGVITFHSLEDRIVKNFFRNLGKECVCPPEFAKCRCGGKQCAEILTRKPVCPGEEEIKVNSPSRSAKLRVVRKLKNAEKLHLRDVSFK